MRRALIGVLVCLLAGMFSHLLTAQNPLPARIDPDRSLPDTGLKPVPQPVGSAPRASVLQLIKFSGTVPDGQGVVGVTFSFYADQEGGGPLWLETQNVELDQQGRYTVLLGATQAEGLPLELFASGQARWLGIQVQGQPEQSRILLVSVPYALRAEEAQRLAGREASEFLLAEQLESKVQEQVETQVQEELKSQGLVSEDGTIKAITDSASTFTDNNSTQVVLVQQQGAGDALRATALNRGVRGQATASSGATDGLRGEASSTAGRGVVGLASAISGSTKGVFGVADSPSGFGVQGWARATSGFSAGVLGQTDSPTGRGLWGLALPTAGVSDGVRGETKSTSGRGVVGFAPAGAGSTTGVLGIVLSPAGTAGRFENRANGKILSGRNSSTEVLSVDGNGNIETDGGLAAGGDVGIGTSNPIQALDVRGAIALGATGQFLVPAAAENLVIIRGHVASNGSISVGSGFAASRTGTGIYSVTPDPSFASFVSVAITPFSVAGRSCTVVSLSSPSGNFEVNCFDTNTKTLTDTSFMFIATGNLAASEISPSAPAAPVIQRTLVPE